MNANVITRTKNALNIKSADYFVSYGMGATARLIVEDLRQRIEVAAGIALTQNEIDECAKMRTKIYTEATEISSVPIFDKVYANYAELTITESFTAIADTCMSLCVDNGLVLFAGLAQAKTSAVAQYLEHKSYPRFWYMNRYGNRFDLLVKKEKPK